MKKGKGQNVRGGGHSCQSLILFTPTNKRVNAAEPPREARSLTIFLSSLVLLTLLPLHMLDDGGLGAFCVS